MEYFLGKKLNVLSHEVRSNCCNLLSENLTLNEIIVDAPAVETQQYCGVLFDAGCWELSSIITRIHRVQYLGLFIVTCLPIVITSK